MRQLECHTIRGYNWGYIGGSNGGYIGVRGYIGIMEKKKEATIYSVGTGISERCIRRRLGCSNS